ncbi:restriction endonuclease subunit S [Gemmatimonas sp.]|jgi:type I restriction enzyme S subunit|uniref:restriction endonuclease subunit S n=1 Tax=Gemmatimonas sp. TaxID=1962908 RepID=UPI0037BF72A3
MSETIESVLKGELRRFKSYPIYKDSGVEWLGDIPADWGVNRLKEVATIQMSNVDKKSVDGEDEVELCNYTDVYYHDRITPDMPFMKATAPREQVRRFALRAGDVLITKDSESWTDIAVPAVVVADMPNVLCGYHLAHIRPKTVMDGAYLSLAIAAVGPRDQFRVAANGVTRFAIGTEAVTTAVFAVPPLSEQRAIAAFLDRETARIDTLVARKERLIALLQERRAALITRAVTKGLNPAAPMKDSGVEWLGEIPAHWEVKRVSDVAESLQTGPFGSQLHADEYVQSGYPVINPANIRESRLIADEDVTVSESVAARLGRHRLQEGDILFARRGELGRCGIVAEEQVGWLCGTGSLRLRLKRRVSVPEFVITYLSAAGVGEWFGLQSVGATMQNLNTSIVGRLPLLVPPTSEQRSIASILSLETARVDALVTRVGKAIARLYELRTALISAAVTGKIDVRETAQ